jgi:3-methyladenine DNA glycosylase AlkD
MENVMKFVWLIINANTNEVIAIYTEEELADKMAPHIETRLKVDTFVVRKSVNQELSRIGIDK